MTHKLLKWIVIVAIVILATPQLFQESRELLANAHNHATAAWWAALLNLPAKNGGLENAIESPKPLNEKGMQMANNFTFSFIRKDCDLLSAGFEKQIAQTKGGKGRISNKTNAPHSASSASFGDKLSEAHGTMILPKFDLDNLGDQIAILSAGEDSNEEAQTQSITPPAPVQKTVKLHCKLQSARPALQMKTAYSPGKSEMYLYEITKGIAQAFAGSGGNAHDGRDNFLLLKSKKLRDTTKILRHIKVYINNDPEYRVVHANPA